MGIPDNALSITAVYWSLMPQNIRNIHILRALIWFNELRLKANGCIIYSIIYFSNEIDMNYVADCIAKKHIFHVFDWKIKSWAVKKPLSSHRERCPAPRNRYAASLRPETVTMLQRTYSPGMSALKTDIQSVLSQSSTNVYNINPSKCCFWKYAHANSISEYQLMHYQITK